MRTIIHCARPKENTHNEVRCLPQRLERDGLVKRHVYQQMPPKVEYSLTEYGVTANTIVDVMCAWGRDNITFRQKRGEEIVLLSET
ncbi:winged helix-turn-helix transcriptional regulator [Paenibacillus sp. JGP012]|uniref:winged helix-turn-helix transcriptional regulator n=1 Tax=Paenibacillus sp. JGP012 TaxID=2735914 RepID=UPI00161665F0|nr:winged helix-turn-helix transcriptional regulator [Paenibacillus sp. JGP012]